MNKQRAAQRVLLMLDCGQVLGNVLRKMNTAVHKIGSNFGQRVAQNLIRLRARSDTILATLGKSGQPASQNQIRQRIEALSPCRPTKGSPLSCASLEEEVRRSDRVTLSRVPH